MRQLIPIVSEAQWDKYVKTIMKNEFQCLDLVVRKLSNDPTPHGYSPPRGFSPEPENPAPSDPPLPNREVEVEDVVLVPDAQSALNEVGVCPDVRAECWSNDRVVAPQEIPLTQNHPSDVVTLSLLLFFLHSIPLSQFYPYLCFICRRQS